MELRKNFEKFIQDFQNEDKHPFTFSLTERELNVAWEIYKAVSLSSAEKVRNKILEDIETDLSARVEDDWNEGWNDALHCIQEKVENRDLKKLLSE